MKKYKMIDLCAGIGGIRKGFEKTSKVDCVSSAEIDKYACLTYEHLYNENPKNDVTSNEYKEILNNINYNILCAGFPCQSFSIAGQKEGFKDTTRGTIFFEIAKIIKKGKPEVIFLENVVGLIGHDKGNTFKVILNTIINELNYEIDGVSINDGNIIFDKNIFIRDARDFGLPQKRRRTYIVAFRKGLKRKGNFSLPKSSSKKIYENVNDILDENVKSKYYLSEQSLDTLKRHKQNHSKKGNGFGYIVVNETEDLLANTILATGGSGKERNLIYSKKNEHDDSYTKQTPPNMEHIRNMTPNEWAKLQGFRVGHF
ncbi:MAG: DNA (cytosine-5-)-methyltransferase [Mycoplasmatales bacterium]